ncbi:MULTISPECIES: M20 family metallo-hydrolase [unclassified Microbacterium]|uniref:M20 family metallo-hydrolase n=1 Tax=unclassified Microbacterium TaxID=2609290 RepID=UPI000EA9E1F6|nr:MULTISPECIES: M20 family metallo-hydrolase [unclassified Microbacterium]MBT2484500.1 M20 family metallo-hydrolase [Microbacterium sp. ISL-108]RKN67404.1 Zn-dependent hydrolase [Microbacterium sp. CGR2]
MPIEHGAVAPAPSDSADGERQAVQAERFLADFARLSAFGATGNGGVDRQAGSEADVAQRRWFAALLEAHGLRVEYDRIGNQFGLLVVDPEAPYVVVGSHLDSQPTAGRYDGAYGVLAAAHAAFRLADEWSADGATTPRYNLAVVNWFNEEGSRFTPSMMGSSVYTGVLPLEQALRTTDRAGTTVTEVLQPAGFLGAGDGPEAAFCAEIHIEQGRVLENSGTTIGLVTASWAASKYVVTVEGAQAHSGATVMGDRRDALYGASLLVVFARELADRFPGVLHTAVGQLDVYPNSPVVVASHVRLLLDLRCADESVLSQANALLQERFAEIEDIAGVGIQRVLSHEWGIDPYQPEGVDLARASAEWLGYSREEILTVAGHDSINMKRQVTTVMLFVPSVDGVSHNEGEYTRDEDLVAGLDVLTDVVRRLAQGELAPISGAAEERTR